MTEHISEIKNYSLNQTKPEKLNYFVLAGVKRELKPKTKEEIGDAVVNIVCRYIGVEKEKLPFKSRRTELVYARQLISYLLYDKVGYSLVEIGELFGGQDHTTVIHSRDRIKDLMSVKSDYVKRDVEMITAQIEEKLKYS